MLVARLVAAPPGDRRRADHGRARAGPGRGRRPRRPAGRRRRVDPGRPRPGPPVAARARCGDLRRAHRHRPDRVRHPHRARPAAAQPGADPAGQASPQHGRPADRAGHRHPPRPAARPGTHRADRGHDQRLDADMVAVVGDLVDGSVAELGPAAAPLRDLRSRYGSLLRHRQPRVLLRRRGVDRRRWTGSGCGVLQNERVGDRPGAACWTWPGSTTSRRRAPVWRRPPTTPRRWATATRAARSCCWPTSRSAASRRRSRRGPAAVRPHPRRPDRAVQLPGQAPAAGGVRPRRGRRHAGLRDQRRRLLGPAGAGRRATRTSPWSSSDRA